MIKSLSVIWWLTLRALLLGAYCLLALISNFLLFLTLLSLTPTSSLAQAELSEGGVSPHWELAVTTGVLLPSNFEGVTETLPPVLYSIDKGFEYFRVEGKYLFASSEGVRFRRAYICIKNYVEIMDILYFWNFGLGATDLLRNNDIIQDSSSQLTGGWHYAMGAKIEINKRVFVKAETGAYIRPGKSIYVGIGLGINFGGEKSESTSP